MDRRVQPPKWRRRTVLIPAVAALVLLLLAGGAFGLISSAKRSVRVPRATVTIETVDHGVFHDFTPLRGKIAPHDTIYLDALEGGQVRQVLAHAGDLVTEGQPLIAFRNTALELDVLDREGRLVESITQLLAYEKQLEDSRVANIKAKDEIDYNITRLGRQAERTDRLAEKGYATAQSKDQLHDELNYQLGLRPVQAANNIKQDQLRAEQLPQIRSQLANLRESLKITRSKLDDLVVRAPVTGRLTDIVQNVGENRNRGERIGEIVPNTGFKVAAEVDEFYLGRVRPGQMATANIGGQTWPLRVERVYPQVKQGVFTIDLSFVGRTPDGLLSGQAIDGKLSLGNDRPALLLPAGAFLDRTGGDWVMVADAHGRHADRRRIKIGRRNAEEVEVLSGLKPGDRVITSDYAGFEKVDRIDLTN
jgi:HlyD family secretion protein